MSKGHEKARRIGMNMKPRGEDGKPSAADLDAVAEEQKAAEETAANPEQCCERDTNGDGDCPIHSAPGVLRNAVMSQAPIIQPIRDRQEPVHNLESALDSMSGVAGLEDLAASIEASRGTTGTTVYDFQGDPVRITLPTPIDGQFEDPEVDKLAEKMTDAFLQELAGDASQPGVRHAGGEDLAVLMNLRKDVATIHTLGEQENGDYKVVVTIPEGYSEAVRQWAESEGKTMEEWMSGHFASYLESWGQPARGR